MNEMFFGFEFVWAYIDDLLIITKGDWYYHLEKPELTLQNIKDNGLKCNTEKSLFGQAGMEYIGVWVTRNVIRPIKNFCSKYDATREHKTGAYIHMLSKILA